MGKGQLPPRRQLPSHPAPPRFIAFGSIEYKKPAEAAEDGVKYLQP